MKCVHKCNVGEMDLNLCVRTLLIGGPYLTSVGFVLEKRWWKAVIKQSDFPVGLKVLDGHRSFIKHCISDRNSLKND